MNRPLKTFNGPAILVALLRAVDPVFRQQLLKKLDGKLPWLARLYAQNEVMFDDLLRIDDRGLQHLLRVVPETQWVTAWKKMSPRMQRRVLGNMSNARKLEFSLQCKKTAAKTATSASFLAQREIAAKATELIVSGKICFRFKGYPEVTSRVA